MVMLSNREVFVPGFAGPLYMQVAAMLRAKIFSSEWTPREPIPNEVALARDVGVSIGTMRKALELLENERLIDRKQGRGTFVVETSTDSEIERFSNIDQFGRKLKADRVEWVSEDGQASAEEAAILQIKPAAPVYRMEADWRAGNGTAVLERAVVARNRYPGLPQHLDEAGQFLFPVYRRHFGEVVCKVAETVRCGTSDSDTSAKLGIEAGTPLLHMQRVAFGMSGGVAEVCYRNVVLGGATYRVVMS